MPAIVTILSPFCIFSWNFLANLAFFACGRIIKSQNTRIIPANKINCKDPPPEGACNKTTNGVIVLLGCLLRDLLLFIAAFFLLLPRIAGCGSVRLLYSLIRTGPYD